MSLNTGNAILSNAITVDSSYRVGVNCAPNAQFEVLGATGAVLTDGIRVSRNTLQSSQYGVINYSSGILNLTGVEVGGQGGIRFNTSDGTTTNERVRISSSGNVGIGTSSPSAKLDVVSSGKVFSFGTSATVTGNLYGVLTYNGADLAYLGNGPSIVSGTAAIDFAISTGNSSANMIFAGNGTERMRIASGGNIGIGNTGNSSYKLLVQGNNASVDSNGQNTIFLSAGPTVSFIDTSYIGGGSYVPMAFGTGGSERMRITTSGNVGIGTTTVSGRLTINNPASDGSTPIISIRDTSNVYEIAYLNFNQSTDMMTLMNKQGYSASGIAFGTNNTERMRITSGGALIIGATAALNATALGRLNAQATGATEPALIVANSSTSQTTTTLVIGAARYTSLASFNYIVCLSGNSSGDQFVTENFKVRGDGVIYAQNTSIYSISDIRTKENIITSNDGLNIINELRPVRFDFKEGFGNNKKNQLGFIAQEVEQVFPDAVDVWGDSNEEGDPYKSLGPTSLIPVLVKAIQEQQAQIEELKAKIK